MMDQTLLHQSFAYQSRWIEIGLAESDPVTCAGKLTTATSITDTQATLKNGTTVQQHKS
jgi:hypothetical protein